MAFNVRVIRDLEVVPLGVVDGRHGWSCEDWFAEDGVGWKCWQAGRTTGELGWIEGENNGRMISNHEALVTCTVVPLFFFFFFRNAFSFFFFWEPRSRCCSGGLCCISIFDHRVKEPCVAIQAIKSSSLQLIPLAHLLDGGIHPENGHVVLLCAALQEWTLRHLDESA